MRFVTFLLIVCLTTLWSETKSNFINEVRDKFGNSDKSYSVKMKPVAKDSKKNKSTEKKSKKHNSKTVDKFFIRIKSNEEGLETIRR